ncbi:MAG: hypothetical protein MJ252_05895 [archaeon]|nr:hypothetical protein [archaeon]
MKYTAACLMNDRMPPKKFFDFSYQTKRNIMSLVNAIIDGTRSNERYKSILNASPNSSGFDCFNSIKSIYSTGISKEDLISFFKLNGINLSIFEGQILMERLDKNKDGIVTYNEFLGEFTPKIK